MTNFLAGLISDAMATANPDDYVLRGRVWAHEGGRSCPFDEGTCSQPVFFDRVTDEWDYGEPAGPGHTWCLRNCEHGHRDALCAQLPLKDHP